MDVYMRFYLKGGCRTKWYSKYHPFCNLFFRCSINHQFKVNFEINKESLCG